MTEHHKNYSVENIGPLEDLLKRDFMPGVSWGWGLLGLGSDQDNYQIYLI